MVRLRHLTTLALLSTCLAIAACPSGKPGDNGEVLAGTGGRDGNSISLYTDRILLFQGDDDVGPSQPVGILHEGPRITITQVNGSPSPPWLFLSPIVKMGQYHAAAFRPAASRR